MKVYTGNSIYEFNEEEKLVRRTSANPNIPLRTGTDWVKYMTAHYAVGEPMRLITEDPGGDKDNLTLRTTSPVVKVED